MLKIPEFLKRIKKEASMLSPASKCPYCGTEIDLEQTFDEVKQDDFDYREERHHCPYCLRFFDARYDRINILTEIEK